MMVQVMILVTSLLGFVGLAAASERHSALILPDSLTLGQRNIVRITGWVLLGIALLLSCGDWGSGVGATAWLGGLSVVGIALVLYLPKWPGQTVKAIKAPRKGKTAPVLTMDDSAVLKTRTKRVMVLSLLGLIPVGFAYALWVAPVTATMRSDAYHGQVGPWTFSFGEVDHDTPDLAVMDIPLKSYNVRFCETCDTNIRHAYLKVRKPRSLRGAGIMFSGAQWDRTAEISFPSNATSSDLLWLTVEGKDGSVHQVSIPLAQISPNTAKWLDENNKK